MSVSFEEAFLSPTDIQLFREPNWLNDRCIDFYFRILEYEDFRGRSDLLFMDPAVVSCLLIQCTDDKELEELGDGLDLRNRRLVFIPINDSQEFFTGCTHWSLLVYDQAEEKYFHFDSSRGHNKNAAVSTLSKFSRLMGRTDGSLTEPTECPQQENGFDCGMYVLVTARFLAHKYVTEGGRLDFEDLSSHIRSDYVAEQRRRLRKRVIEMSGSGTTDVKK